MIYVQSDLRTKWYSCIMIDCGLFMMIYKPSKLIYSSVHIDRVYHFMRYHFSRIPLYTYISLNGPREKDERTRNIWAIKNDRFSRAKYAWLYRCACYIWWFFYELMFICTYVYLHTITAYICMCIDDLIRGLP